MRRGLLEGALAGALWGAVARVFMRLLADDPEFSGFALSLQDGPGSSILWFHDDDGQGDVEGLIRQRPEPLVREQDFHPVRWSNQLVARAWWLRLLGGLARCSPARTTTTFNRSRHVE